MKNPSEPSPPPSPICVDATVTDHTRRAPWWAPVLRPVASLASLLPAYNDTRRGRKNARHLRIGLGGASGLTLLLGTQPLFLAIAASLFASIFVLPVRQITRRTLIANLNRLRRPSLRPVQLPGQVKLDHKRLTLHVDGDKRRRILIDRPGYEVRLGTYHHYACMRITDSTGARSKSISILSSLNQTPPDAPIDDDLVDLPALVDPAAFSQLQASLVTR